ncbi:Conserved_hypothetical protein [Hexamita inflata]|uniref:Uncharacterized protein n=1 Tax=Hexamita inflata TaxID=28002 RepID=A0AA86P5R7_9EUKA|nr:Conserved hypothetical protein [Hexamita inflata]
MTLQLYFYNISFNSSLNNIVPFYVVIRSFINHFHSKTSQIIFSEFHNRIGPHTLYKYPNVNLVSDDLLLNAAFSADFSFGSQAPSYSFQAQSTTSELFCYVFHGPDQYQRGFSRKFAILYLDSPQKMRIFGKTILKVCDQIYRLVYNGLMIRWDRERRFNTQTINALLNNEDQMEKLVVRTGSDVQTLKPQLQKLLDVNYQQHFKKIQPEVLHKAVELLTAEQQLQVDDFDRVSGSSLDGDGYVCVDEERMQKLQLSFFSYQVYRETEDMLPKPYITAVQQCLQRLLQYVSQPIRVYHLNNLFSNAEVVVYAHAIPILYGYIQPEQSSFEVQNVYDENLLQVFRPDLQPYSFDSKLKILIDPLPFKSAAAEHFNLYLDVVKSIQVRFQNLIYLQARWKEGIGAAIYHMLDKKPVIILAKNNRKRIQKIADCISIFKIQLIKQKQSLNLNVISKVFLNINQIETLVQQNSQIQIFLLENWYTPEQLGKMDCLVIDTDKDNFYFNQADKSKCQYMYDQLSDYTNKIKQELYGEQILKLITSFAQQAQLDNFHNKQNSQIYQGFLINVMQQFITMPNPKYTWSPNSKWSEYIFE